MAVTAGPKIIKDNLVMYMDKDNTVRSWKGKPTTNRATDFNNATNIASSGLTITANSGKLPIEVLKQSSSDYQAD